MSRYIYIILAMLLWVNINVSAQEPMSVNFHISAQYKTKEKVHIFARQYARFKTKKKAMQVLAELKEAYATDGYNGSTFEMAIEKNMVRFKAIKENNTFNIPNAYPGQAVIVFINEQTLECFEIKEGKTEYNEIVIIGSDNNITLNETIAKGNLKRNDGGIITVPALDLGDVIGVPVRFSLPRGEVGERSRVLVQPVAIDCQTEDTIGYVTPLIFEGNRYHELQNRRMGYNYIANEMDSIARGYIANRALKDTVALVVDTTIIYKKPDPRKNYKFHYYLVAEDYTHTNRSLSAGAGSCNKFSPFKFLNMNGIAAEMNLNDFKVDAEEIMQQVPRDLRLNFLVGKSELTKDSMNYVLLDTLVSEMKRYGESLMRIEIEAFSSPDGGYDKNLKLAKERGQVAMNLVLRGLGRADVTKGLSTKVYSWDDVVAKLEEEKKNGMADSVKQVLNAVGKAAPDRNLRSLPFYDSDIEPILQDMRAMRCVYKYERMHIMDEDEVLDYYFKHKHVMPKGDKAKGINPLSEGDYYNLFCCIKDSAELDTLTNIAYQHMKSQPEWEKIKFSRYVANRMAIYQTKSGHAKTETLAPFIDLTIMNSPFFKDGVTKNSKEALINQIIVYLQQEKRDTAMTILHNYFSESNDSVVTMLKSYVGFKNTFYQYYTGQPSPLSEEEKRLYENTEKFVFDCDPNNKAILYTEGRAFMNKSNEECLDLVEKMSNDNAKKWYLRGILEADKENVRPVPSIKKDYIPLYLALFWKSFTIDPDLRLTYFQEAHISDDLRKKYKYRKRDIPKYKELLAKYLSSDDTVDDKNEFSGRDDENDTNNNKLVKDNQPDEDGE